MSSEQYPQTDAAPAPRCYRHPNRETWVRCTRCDRPICPDCLRPAAVGFQCPDCVAGAHKNTRVARTPYGGRVVDNAAITITLAVLNVAAFVFTGIASPDGFLRNYDSNLFFDLALIPALVTDNEYYRLITSAFLHIGIFHLAVNMMALAVVGPGLERVFGRWRYLALYLVSALGGGVAVYAFGNPIGATAGASGAIFGLFGATVVVLRQIGLDPRQALVVIGINLVITFAVPGISKLGHLGGLAVGTLCAAALVYAPKGRYRLPIQIGSVAVLVGIMLIITLVRTEALTG